MDNAGLQSGGGKQRKWRFGDTPYDILTKSQHRLRKAETPTTYGAKRVPHHRPQLDHKKQGCAVVLNTRHSLV